MIKIHKNKYEYICKELREWEEEGLISKDQTEKIKNRYHVVKDHNFIRILIMIGFLSIGLGILTFIASNWPYISKLGKVALIIVSIMGTFYGSYLLRNSHEKISKGLILLGVFIYGAGIFLIGQIFNYGGTFASAFLIWTIGSLLVAFINNEKSVFILSNILFLFYMGGSFSENIILESIVFIGGFYYINRFFNYSKIITSITNIISIVFIMYLGDYFNVEGIYILLGLFTVGVLMYNIKHSMNFQVFRYEGLGLLSVTGIILTFESVWRNFFGVSVQSMMPIVFAIGLIVYLLFLIKEGNIIPLVFVYILIFRYYFDSFYDFMPKSGFFLIGGIILLSFGYYFEKIRKSR